MIEVYVENAGKRGEGDWLTLPASQGHVQSLLSRIGVDGVNYQEIIITDYVHNIPGAGLGEYENLDELNYLASLLSEMADHELDAFEAAATRGNNSGSAEDLINLAQNPACHEYFPGVGEDSELGEYLVDVGYAIILVDTLKP